MASTFCVFIVTFLLSTTLGEDAGSPLGDIINNLFNTNEMLPIPTIFDPEPSTQPGPNTYPAHYKSCGLQKECVPRWLCKGGQIVTDGQVILNTRFRGAVCGPIDICCHISDMAIHFETSIKNQSHPNDIQVIPKIIASEPQLVKPAPEQAQAALKGFYKSCGVQKECVPRWLCKGGQIITDGQVILNTRFSGAVCDPIEICCHISDMEMYSQNLMSNLSSPNDLPTIPTPEPSSQPQLLQAQYVRPDEVGGLYRSCGIQKECVPRWLCKEGEIVTDGQVILSTRFSSAVCDTLEICCHISDKLTDSIRPFAQAVQHEGCGYQNLASIGFQTISEQDDKSQFGEFPWVVAILRDAFLPGIFFSMYECSGALIAPTVVLAAGHCVQDLQAELLVVRAGEWFTQLELQSPQHQERRVKKKIVHERFNKGTLANDIALLFVRSPFQWERNVRPICLPEADAIFDDTNCYAIGWGREILSRKSTYPASLKKIPLSFVPHDRCQASLRTTRLGRNFQLDESFMCAASEKGKPLFVDTGTLLVCAVPGTEGRFRQAGIDAWGTGYGNKNIPRVFANVAHLRKWLDNKLLQNSIDFSEFTLKNK